MLLKDFCHEHHLVEGTPISRPRHHHHQPHTYRYPLSHKFKKSVNPSHDDQQHELLTDDPLYTHSVHLTASMHQIMSALPTFISRKTCRLRIPRAHAGFQSFAVSTQVPPSRGNTLIAWSQQLHQLSKPGAAVYSVCVHPMLRESTTSRVNPSQVSLSVPRLGSHTAYVMAIRGLAQHTTHHLLSHHHHLYLITSCPSHAV